MLACPASTTALEVLQVFMIQELLQSIMTGLGASRSSGPNWVTRAAFWEVSCRSAPHRTHGCWQSPCTTHVALEKAEIGESLAVMHMLLGRVSASEDHNRERDGKTQQSQLKKKKKRGGLGMDTPQIWSPKSHNLVAKCLIYYCALSWDKTRAANQPHVQP